MTLKKKNDVRVTPYITKGFSRIEVSLGHKRPCQERRKERKERKGKEFHLIQTQKTEGNPNVNSFFLEVKWPVKRTSGQVLAA